MQLQQVIDCYNKTADNYALHLFDELSHKPFDRLILNQFAKENKGNRKLIDLGCGPGQTTRFLFEAGVENIVGTDVAPLMVQKAKQLNPSLHFEVADMLNLTYPDNTFGSAVAFYSIVHFTETELKKALSEIKRILKDGGQFLFSFHIGNEIKHLDSFFDLPVNIDFYFFETEKILSLVTESGFKIIDAIERYPYPDVEHPSKRAYIWLEK